MLIGWQIVIIEVIKLLVAQLPNGDTIELTNQWSKEQLQSLRTANQFYCPTCHGEVILKLGTKKQWHFAHVKENRLCQNFERESDFHLLGKKQLYLWLKKSKHTVYLEKYLANIQQRPDIYYKHQNNQVALEYQCSPISFDLHYKRTLTYLQHHIYPLWIIGANRLERIASHLFKLHPFEWSSTFLRKNDRFPHLLYYCPEEQSLILLQNIISLSKSIIFATLKTNRLTTISSFQQLFRHQRSTNMKQHWIQIKKHWRYFHPPYPSKSLRFFQQYCYERKLFSFLFPAISGWPVNKAYFIETPLYIWQSWLVYEFIWKKPIGEVIYFYTVYEAFKQNLRKGYFSVRILPLLEGHYSFAIMNYLQLLCQFGMLRKKSRHLFVIQKQIEELKTIEEAVSLDEYYCKMIKFL